MASDLETEQVGFPSAFGCVADIADGALAVRDSDVIVAIGSKAFELARAQPGSAAIVAAAVLTPQPGGSHPITAVPMESRAGDALDALRALAPNARRVLVLHPPGDSPMLSEARAAAKARGLSAEFRALGDLSGLEGSLHELLQGQQALWLLPDARLARPEVAKFLVATCLDRKLPLIGFLAGMAQPVVVDGRRILDRKKMNGIRFHRIG